MAVLNENDIHCSLCLNIFGADDVHDYYEIGHPMGNFNVFICPDCAKKHGFRGQIVKLSDYPRGEKC